MASFKLSFEDASDYYRKDFFDSYKSNCEYFKSVGMPTISQSSFYRWNKDNDTRFTNFKKMYNKGLFEKYYLKYDCESEEEEQVVEEEEQVVEEEVVEEEEEKPYTTDLEKDIYFIFEGAFQPHHTDPEYIEVMELYLNKKLKTFDEYKKWKKEKDEVVEEEQYPDDKPYDPNWQEIMDKEEIERFCRKITDSIIEDAIKIGVPPITKEDEEKKECDRCSEWCSDYTEFAGGNFVCKECMEDVEVLKCIASDYYNLKNNIYKQSVLTTKNKLVEKKKTATGKVKKIKTGAKCDGHNPNKSNDDTFNPLMCSCRIWNEGYGGQCQKKAVEGEMCKSHYKADVDDVKWWFGRFDEDKPTDIYEIYSSDVSEYLPKSVFKGALNKDLDFKWK
jgi:hypothetical protein